MTKMPPKIGCDRNGEGHCDLFGLMMLLGRLALHNKPPKASCESDLCGDTTCDSTGRTFTLVGLVLALGRLFFANKSPQVACDPRKGMDPEGNGICGPRRP